MNLNSRLAKLERQSPDHMKLPEFIFYTTFEPNPTGGPGPGKSYPGPAKIVGSDFGLIHPTEGETKVDFERRVFAIRAGGKMTEDMDDDELVAAYEAGERLWAKEMERRK